MASVYFVCAPKSQLVKIGLAVDVQRRFAQLQAMSPEPIHLLGVIEGDRALECRLHRRFALNRHHGEWFNLTSSIREYVLENLSGVPVNPWSPQPRLLVRRSA